MSKNDDVILKLKDKIKEKKKIIGSVPKFTPKTNCSLELDDLRHNLHTLNKVKATDLLVILNIIRMSVRDLGLIEYKYCNYKLDDWIHDIQSIFNKLIVKEEKLKLIQLEEKLHTMLSTDKEVELEIDEIAKMLE